MDMNAFTNHSKAWQFVEDFEYSREPDGVREVRALAQLNELPQSSAAQGNLLNMLVRMLHADSVIVVGTGALVETAQLVEGLENHGKITVVDSSADGIRVIREFIADLADRSQTTMRAVNADAGTFLQRLNPDDYDLIVVSGEPANYAGTFRQAASLLHRGGAIVFTDALALDNADSSGGLTNAADRSPKAVALRELIEAVQEDDQFVSSLTPTGTGLLIAVKR
ncbi:O-methyltransferase [Bifidobacterium gallicum]|uniref:O-methyltransferase n=1 Tax=Bifidobacterium gallicum DSM 20093 = LMG 11596 TaxID=561180 RepID=D1NRZ3_9BIFI|nr:O-methyltransferase [Bifidobacterium gallicum]EFA23445.1 O-methyltransferase [Bifidobacterium gallicum DSM 20093 = LMG 11596]KFI57263.1 O-methyltransferase [Bifidobacterium gallicum DSM 20093 = LMG 11596]